MSPSGRPGGDRDFPAGDDGTGDPREHADRPIRPITPLCDRPRRPRGRRPAERVRARTRRSRRSRWRPTCRSSTATTPSRRASSSQRPHQAYRPRPAGERPARRHPQRMRGADTVDSSVCTPADPELSRVRGARPWDRQGLYRDHAIGPHARGDSSFERGVLTFGRSCRPCARGDGSTRTDWIDPISRSAPRTRGTSGPLGTDRRLPPDTTVLLHLD